MSKYLVLRPATSLSPSGSCVYIPRVEACTFTIPFTIMCRHTSCLFLHLHYPLHNRVSTYLVLRHAPSLSPSESGVYIPRVFSAPSLSTSESCVYIPRVEAPSLHPSESCVYIPRVEAPYLHPSESCVYIPRVEAFTFSIPFTIVCLHISR